MGPVEVGGLPAHILIVHFVIVMVPLAALLTVLSAVWPAARRKLGFLAPLAALAALISVPVATHAGEWLEERVARTPLVERHTELGDTLLPWAIGLFAVAAAQWAYYRFAAPESARTETAGTTVRGDAGAAGGPLLISVVIAVLAVVVSVGSVVQVYRIGESGSKAVWSGSFSEEPRN